MRVAAPGPRAVWRPSDPAVSLPSDSCEDSSSFVYVVGWVSPGPPTLRVLLPKTQRLSPSRTAGATGCKSAVIVIEQLSDSVTARDLDGLQQLAAHGSNSTLFNTEVALLRGSKRREHRGADANSASTSEKHAQSLAPIESRAAPGRGAPPPQPRLQPTFNRSRLPAHAQVLDRSRT